jgi:hypothetical protein
VYGIYDKRIPVVFNDLINYYFKPEDCKMAVVYQEKNGKVGRHYRFLIREC